MITIQLLTRRYSEGTAPKRGGINESHEDIRKNISELDERGETDRFPQAENVTALVIKVLLTERQIANQEVS